MSRLAQGFAIFFVLAISYIAFVGISIDASSLRVKIAEKFSLAMGREVRFDGPLQLEISVYPKLRVGGLHILNQADWGGEFASLREARLSLDLLALLGLHLQIEELAGQDVQLHLKTNKNGLNNFTFTTTKGDNNASIPLEDQRATDKNYLNNLLARLDIQRISLENLNVEFQSASGKNHYFELNSLVAQLPAGQAVSMTLLGKVEKQYPYQLDFIGGELADLLHKEQPWPIEMVLSFMNSRLALSGSISAGSGELLLGLGTENLSEFDRLFQTKLPAVGAAGISGNIIYSPNGVSLNNINGVMGRTTLTGDLHFDNGAARSKVVGELTLPTLDLRPFLSDKPVEDDAPAKSLMEIYQELSKASFNLKALNDIDANLSLRVGKWLSLPGEVHDAKMQLKLESGHLSVPISADIAGVQLRGNASVDASKRPSRFNLSLATHHSSVGNLAELLLGVTGVEGTLDRFDLRVKATGDQGEQLMESLDVQLGVERGKLSYGNDSGGNAVNISLNHLLFSLPSGKPLYGEISGALLENEFKATLQGSTLKKIMQQADAPIDLSIQAGSAHVAVHGVLKQSTEDSGSHLKFDLLAPHSSEISSWLGLKKGVDIAVKMHGNLQIDQHAWHLADFSLQLGNSRLTADVFRKIDHLKSLIQLQLIADLIDLDELQSLFPEQDKKSTVVKAETDETQSSMIDIPILPNGINLADSDIVVRINRIKTSTPFSVRDMRFDGRIRDGMLYASPFAANVAETEFTGSMLLDLRSQKPNAQLWLAADNMNIGRVLNKLDISNHIEANLDHLRLYFDLHSSKLSDLLAHSDMLASFDGGHFTLSDANTDGKMRIELDNGELKSSPGSAIHMDLKGSLDSVPVNMRIQTASAVDLLNPALSIPLKFNAESSGASIQLSGNIVRPFAQKDAVFALDMKGDRFDNLNSILHTSLPPWGPWSVTGNFRSSSSGYEVSALQLQVGSSQLKGYGKLLTKVAPAQLDVGLTASTIQLDDFKFGNWSANKAKSTETKKESKVAIQSQKIESKNNVKKLLSRDVLQRQNANITVKVDQVISGEDILGNGRFDAQLKNGRADIGPMLVNTPGGSAFMKLVYEPTEKDVAFSFKSEIKHFDYGVLARRIDKKSEMSGVLSLDVDISAHAQYLEDLMRYGKGYIDFSIWPENLKSGKLDLWAVNALMALLPAVDSSNQSKVNCAIGRFTLDKGKLTHKKFLIDTSRMRVTAKGEADFNSEKIYLYAQPHAKSPQFLSFAIPVELSGTFEDFSVGVRPADVLEMTGQLVTSVIWVPMQMLFGKTVPSDGSDVCRD